MRKLIFIAFAIVTMFAISSCAAKLPDISEYGDAPIEIIGLTDENFTITPTELAKLKLTNTSATGATAKAGTVSGVGVSLIDFLAEYGKAPGDFKTIRFTASDEYSIRLSGEKHTDDLVLLAVSGKDKPLPEVERPLRLIIPNAESNQWVYGVVKIEFEAK
jgi:DMSO/TMAO reductase YedYZ molybdopterin-dependent catalytic subunit